MMDYSSVSDDEFFAEIERIYGEEWTPKDIEENNPELYSEYLKRVSTGV
jgi:hypothetical protein